jgi:prepilin-type N-terminal cleavage/methylation domain-containing protein
MPKAKSPVRGFTLIELIVVIVIISVVTLIALLGHSNFDRSMLLTDAAYSLALGAREMQTFGLSSRTFDVGSGTYAANIAYGLHVNSTALNSYLLFADTNRTTGNPPLSNCVTGTDQNSPDYKRGNCMYETTSPADGIVQRYSFSRGFRISHFCGKKDSTTYCSTDGTSPLTTLDIVFMRPNTDAIMTGQRSGAGRVDFTSAAIYLTTPDNSATRAVCFTRVGQVSVVLSGTCP